MRLLLRGKQLMSPGNYGDVKYQVVSLDTKQLYVSPVVARSNYVSSDGNSSILERVVQGYDRHSQHNIFHVSANVRKPRKRRKQCP